MTTFTWSARRFAAGYLAVTSGIIVAANGVMAAVAWLLARRPLTLSSGLELFGTETLSDLTGAAIGCACIVLLQRKRPPWVRVGPDGLECAAMRGDAVFVAWPVVASTRIRWRGFFARLEVTVTDPALVGWASRGAGKIVQVRRDGAVTYLVDIGAMRGGPRLLEALLREARGPAGRPAAAGLAPGSSGPPDPPTDRHLLARRR